MGEFPRREEGVSRRGCRGPSDSEVVADGARGYAVVHLGCLPEDLPDRRRRLLGVQEGARETSPGCAPAGMVPACFAGQGRPCVEAPALLLFRREHLPAEQGGAPKELLREEGVRRRELPILHAQADVRHGEGGHDARALRLRGQPPWLRRGEAPAEGRSRGHVQPARGGEPPEGHGSDASAPRHAGQGGPGNGYVAGAVDGAGGFGERRACREAPGGCAAGRGSLATAERSARSSCASRAPRCTAKQGGAAGSARATDALPAQQCGAACTAPSRSRARGQPPDAFCDPHHGHLPVGGFGTGAGGVRGVHFASATGANGSSGAG